MSLLKKDKNGRCQVRFFFSIAFFLLRNMSAKKKQWSNNLDKRNQEDSKGNVNLFFFSILNLAYSTLILGKLTLG